MLYKTRWEIVKRKNLPVPPLTPVPPVPLLPPVPPAALPAAPRCHSSSCPRNEVNENDKRASVRRPVPGPAPSGCPQSPLPYPRNEIVERGNENESYAAEAAPRWHPGTRASVREPRTRNEVSVNEDPRTRTPVCTVCKHSPRGSDCRSKQYHQSVNVYLSN